MLANFKESVQGIAAIAVLAAVFWGVRHHSLADLTASRDDSPAASAADEFQRDREGSSADAKHLAGPRRRSIPIHARDLPACADLAEALRHLQAARTAVQETSIDADAAETAQNQYRDAISQVRVELSRLHNLVAPDQYGNVCGDVIATTLPDDVSRVSAWELVNLGEGVSL